MSPHSYRVTVTRVKIEENVGSNSIKASNDLQKKLNPKLAHDCY